MAFGTSVQRTVVRPAGITEPLAGDWSVATGAPLDPNVKSRYDQAPAPFAQTRPKYVPAASCGTVTLVRGISPESKTSLMPGAVPTRRAYDVAFGSSLHENVLVKSTSGSPDAG